MKRTAFEIDRHNLDTECEGQPVLMHDAATLYADEMDRARVAKAEMDLVWAETDLLIRKDPTKFVPNGSKITEGLIESLIKMSKRYQQALRAYLEAEHASGLAKAAVDAAEHRKRMLELEVQLQGRDYFSSPKTKFEGVDQPKKKRRE